MEILLSTAYFPPIQYMSKLLLADKVYIEAHEHYTKQSYRNRCEIYGANGKQTLSIPLVRGRSHKQPIRDIEIDYSENWAKNHFKSIESAYRSSPFYEFYIDDLLPFWQKEYRFLFDFNAQILNTVCELLPLRCTFSLTNDFEKESANDFRDSIHPKPRLNKPDDRFTPLPYTQVFDNKYGFIPNLSILDLLFNEGSNASSVLKSCIR